MLLDGSTLDVRYPEIARAKLGIDVVVGPTGATGATGPAGPRGATGPAGPSGTPSGIDVTVLTHAYTFTNATPLRTINVSTATLTDALNCLAALCADLKAAGILPP